MSILEIRLQLKSSKIPKQWINHSIFSPKFFSKKTFPKKKSWKVSLASCFQVFIKLKNINEIHSLKLVLKRGPFGTFRSQNIKTIERGPFEVIKSFSKKDSQCRKNWKGDPLVLPGFVLRGKTEKRVWSSPLGQMVQFDAIKIRITL